jgi:RNA polymerase sigma-70 factor, ECF subfamily
MQQHDVEQPQSEDDRVLAKRAVYDRQAFAVLYRRHVDRVYRYCRFRVHNEQDAQDLTAQTFMAALEQIGHYRGEGTVAAWLLGIAYYKSVDLLRATSATDELDAADELAAPDPQPEALLTQVIQRSELEQALRLLAPERAEALSLRFFGELSNREVAAIMQKSEDAVKMLIHRGIQELRVRLPATMVAA